MSRRRLLTVAHHYVVQGNRRLAHELQRQGEGKWEVTAVSPTWHYENQRRLFLQPQASEPCRLEAVPLRLSRWPHAMSYASPLSEILSGSWDLVHASEEPYLPVGGQIAFATPRRTPLVFRSGQAVAKSYPPPFSWIEDYCRARCAGWIGSQCVSEAMLARGYGNLPHRRIPFGIDLDVFRPDPAARADTRRRLGWGEGPPVVGFGGRLVAEKGLTLLMRALDRLSAPWRALIVGSGPLEGTLRDWLARAPHRIRLITGVPHAEMPAYLNAMDVLCLPSRTTGFWRESFGRILTEAMACALSVIGSDSGEIPHVLGSAGRIVGEGDEEALTGALGELLDNEGLRMRLGRAALERARACYALPVVARAHLDFFEDILQAGKR